MEPEILLQEVRFSKALVASRPHVEYAVRMQVGYGDPLADLLCLRDRDVYRGRKSGDFELWFQNARRFLGWPVLVGERLGRRPLRVHEQARFVSQTPGVSEGLVEHNITVVQALGHWANRCATRQGRQPCVFRNAAHDALVRVRVRDPDVQKPDEPETRRNRKDSTVCVVYTEAHFAVRIKS